MFKQWIFIPETNVDEVQLMVSFVPNWISSFFWNKTLQSSVFGVQSSPGNKRKWVSLPLEEASRDDDGGGDKMPGGGPDTEPTSDSPDPTSPNHTLHNNRAHDSGRSKWPAARCFLFTPLFCFFTRRCLPSTSCLHIFLLPSVCPESVFFTLIQSMA